MLVMYLGASSRKGIYLRPLVAIAFTSSLYICWLLFTSPRKRASEVDSDIAKLGSETEARERYKNKKKRTKQQGER
jgi:hypothetical protein